MREQLGVAPVLPVDSATKGYADTIPTLGAAPLLGSIIPDATHIGFGTGIAMVSGKQTFHRLYLDPGTYDALMVNVVGAQSGGSVSLTGSLYNDDGSGSWMDTSVPPFLSAAYQALTATGPKYAVFGSPLVVTRPMVFWTGTLYLVTTAPTTAPTLTAVNSNLQNLSRTPGTAFGPIRGYVRTGQTAPGASTASTTANVTISGSQDITAVAARRSA